MEAQFNGEIVVPPDLARRRVNGYLVQEVDMFMIAGEPMLIQGDTPYWRLSVILRLRGLGNLGEVGVIDVDARTGRVKTLSEDEIQAVQERAYNLLRQRGKNASSHL